MAEPPPAPEAVESPVVETPVAETPAAEAPAVETPAAGTPVAESVTAETPASSETPTEVPAEGTSEPVATKAVTTPAETPAAKPEKPTKKKVDSKKADKKPAKKVSPRQRRRRWLVSVLKPLQGKKFAGDKLSAFQIVMLGRALRSQVAVCEFEYDAAKLVVELQRTAAGFNRSCEEKLQQIVFQNEAIIREAAEAAWWDDLQERASSRLISVTGDTLRRHINRGAVDAKVVFAIDAVGPRTAAATIVSADGKLLHSEDLPCQLSTAQRSAAVARMGELIHTHHVNLIVISNGPARRSLMVAIGDLIKQSPEKSVRWTLAERGGADAYASSSVADQEMRSTPRRFRAAAWLAFSILQPAQAMAKVDPLKLRLSSFQRELSDDALASVLDDIMVSGASRGGVDVNSAPQSWLRRLPGVTEAVATAIEKRRRESLFESREAILGLEQWTSEVESRQALPFLRVFGSEEPLDGTLVHPSDYPLAQKLAKALSIELPPASPPGYEKPDYSTAPASSDDVKAIEVVEKTTERVVEEFTTSGEKSPEFSIADEPAVTDSDPEAMAPTEVEQSASEETATEEATSAEPVAETTEAPTTEPIAEASTKNEATDTPESEAPATEPAAKTLESVKRPLPERASIDKCIKEWQIGKRRTHQIVHWLCDPFGDSDVSGAPPAVMTKVPSLKELTPGDEVIGVVVGVMPFGIFVELAPDCSGLVHVSRVSDSYVEDLHEAVQVGDVVTAWVTGIEEKKRRVALSALSPQREAEIAEARRNQPRPDRGGPNRGGGQARGVHGNSARGNSGQGSGGQSRGGQGQSQGGGQGQRGGQSRGGGGRQDSRGGGGRSRDGRGGKSREKRVESYRVVAKPEAKPLTDAMVKGEEPMRSFGDLAQLFGNTKKPEPKTVKPKPKPPAETPKPVEEASAPETATPKQVAPEKPAAETPASQPPAPESDTSAS